MNKVIGIALGAIMAGCAMPAQAQIVLEANGARADERWGGELGVGYDLAILPGLKVTPAVGALIYAQDNGRYYLDDNGGSQACRDNTNGRYADKELCNNTRLRAYGRVEATYSVPLVATLGIGARISDEIVPYGTIAFPVAPRIQLKGNVGDGYYAAGLRLTL
ncbi:hypothetical protein [Sphingomonas sp. Leaf4]|uniref:hypothetical protein n=1 Tax=Sphingomonas sp. Leaf4 TaxID=2876553 RepID=UPI001E47B1D9|nr:hypothetical protein [Sphingomonas sp. Leaf4]